MNKETILAERLKDHLRKFPLYQESHSVSVVIKDETIYVSYAPTPRSMINLDSTHFDLEIRGEVLDVLGFKIERSERRKGYGTKLQKVVEEFGREIGCKRVVRTPSGQSSIDFLRATGYTVLKDRWFEKEL